MYSVQASFFTVKRGPFSAVVNVSTDEGGNVHTQSIKRNLIKSYVVESATASLVKNMPEKSKHSRKFGRTLKGCGSTTVGSCSHSISCSLKLLLVFLLNN